MLSQRNRLKEKKAFLRVIRQGGTAKNDILLLRFRLRKDSEGTSPKIGFSASLKFSKKAVERNKARRLMREAVRPLVKKISPGAEIVFSVNPALSLRELSLKKVGESAKKLLIKANLIIK
jgi:ribonuclease P protein component